MQICLFIVSVWCAIKVQTDDPKVDAVRGFTCSFSNATTDLVGRFQLISRDINVYKSNIDIN